MQRASESEASIDELNTTLAQVQSEAAQAVEESRLAVAQNAVAMKKLERLLAEAREARTLAQTDKQVS